MTACGQSGSTYLALRPVTRHHGEPITACSQSGSTYRALATLPRTTTGSFEIPGCGRANIRCEIVRKGPAQRPPLKYKMGALL